MAFRKRNTPVSKSSSAPSAAAQQSRAQVEEQAATHAPGVRSSPADGRATTSTGTPSLDALLAGHAGLPLGHSVLIEETGTTDYAGALLRCYAAEGIVQGHCVHVVGSGPGWVTELPGLVEGRGERSTKQEMSTTRAESERMKIAWRYERMGSVNDRVSSTPSDPSLASLSATKGVEGQTYCHTFDLAKRLKLPASANIVHHPIHLASTAVTTSPFTKALQSLHSQLSISSPEQIHRIVLPNLLSPISYPPQASRPHHLLQFLHALRALLRRHSSHVTAMLSLPLTLHPRNTGLIRWAEHLLDGVIELAPFPFRADDYAQNRLGTSGAATSNEERPQGMVKIHKLPVFHERGGGGGAKALGDDLAFTVSRRRFAIRPFSLPPEDGDTEAQKEAQGEQGMPAKAKMEF